MHRPVLSPEMRAKILQQGQDTLRTESEAIADIADHLGEEFLHACGLILGTQGRVVVSGIGKSGAVGRKIASTLASTGTPAFFMHPAEALHGDLGMISDGDVVIMLSNSGETQEILAILPSVKRRRVDIIAMCGMRNSTLCDAADVFLDCSCTREACPLGLAPTTSAVVTLAVGDALATAVMAARGFSAEDYAATHPGGSLGRRLLLRVRDVMHTGEDNPRVSPDASIVETLLTMSTAPVRGVVNIVDEEGMLRGLFTDGDFRVLMQRHPDRNAIMDSPISDFMTRTPTTVLPDVLAAEALRIMEERKFDNLPVIDEDGRSLGIVDIQDLMNLRVI